MSGYDEALSKYRSEKTRSLVSKEMCPDARDFQKKVESTIFSMLGDSTTPPQMMSAKYYLQEEWHNWRNALPASHPKTTIPSLAHLCIDDIYFDSYNRLRLLTIKLDLLRYTPKPPEPSFPTLSIPKDFSLGVSPDDVIDQLE